MPIETDVCVIGAGSGGLSTAVSAVQMGARVVLVERDKMGGDCLNYGCVPSKALLAAAHTAEDARQAMRYGLEKLTPKISQKAVHAHVHDVIAQIEPHDSIARMESLGIQVLKGAAQFTGPQEIKVGKETVRAKWFVIATGSAPATPPISGLDRVPHLTNETLFDVTKTLPHLLIIGGGPIGMEMALAHRRLGSKVTLFQRTTILCRDDPEAVEVVRKKFEKEGIEVLENVTVKKVSTVDGNPAVTYRDSSKEVYTKTGSHLLVSAGRKPNIETLNLDKAGVIFTPQGIKVDQRLRTKNKRIFAIGDVIGQHLFTHMASHHAGIVIKNMLFWLPAKIKTNAVPWVTYVDPELAQVGPPEEEARRHYTDLKVLRFSFKEIDRAQAEHKTEGFIKVLTTRNGRIISATIVGAHAGELILPWGLAIQEGMNIRSMAGLIAPYPTLSEINKRVAGSYFTPYLFGERTRKVVQFLMRWT